MISFIMQYVYYMYSCIYHGDVITCNYIKCIYYLIKLILCYCYSVTTLLFLADCALPSIQHCYCPHLRFYINSRPSRRAGYLFLWNKSLRSPVPQIKIFNFCVACSLELPLCPCSPRFKTFVDLFPWNESPCSPVPKTPERASNLM